MAINNVPQDDENNVSRIKRVLLYGSREDREGVATRLAEIFVAGLKVMKASATELTEQQRIDQTAADLLADVNI